MSSHWQLLSTLTDSMPLQMAIDEVLLKDQKESELLPVLRFYYASEPYISIGYAGHKRAGYELRKDLDYPICRRITGGGNVVHGKDLIFSFLGRIDSNVEKLGSAECSYKHFHEVIKRAFSKLGFKTDYYKCDEDLPVGRDCFIYPVPTDLKYQGEKIAGGAQKRSEGVLLHQESIQPPESLELAALEIALKQEFKNYFEIEYHESDIEPRVLVEANEKVPQVMVEKE